MSQTATLKQKIIGLALSGGGMRAAAFHAGVLKYLAEQNLLENVVHISSVSGGSLFTGLVFRLEQYKWPTSNDYLGNVLEDLRQIFTSKSLERQTRRKWIFRLLFNPLSWLDLILILVLVVGVCCYYGNYIYIIALGASLGILTYLIYRFRYTKFNALSQAISQSWDIKATLSQLPDFPVWSINATTDHTGHRFRFKAMKMGDRDIGYADSSQFSLAEAMATSAAFPGLVGPKLIRVSDYQWESPQKIAASYFNLYDGGVYDNLGMEPLFDAGKQILREAEDPSEKINYLLVSDGGAKLSRKSILNKFHPMRLARIVDIIMDQVHALRIRSFVNFLRNNPNSGVYVGIGKNFKSSLQNFREKNTLINNVAAEKLEKEKWLSEQEVNRAKDHDTDLKSMTKEEFNCLVLHGYETAKWNVELFWDNI